MTLATIVKTHIWMRPLDVKNFKVSIIKNKRTEIKKEMIKSIYLLMSVGFLDLDLYYL